MPRQNIDALLWRAFVEAQELLHDLEAVEGKADLDTANDLAGQFLKVITDHVGPLRRVIEAVEDHERASAEAEDRALSGMGEI